jgi:adenylate kinase
MAANKLRVVFIGPPGAGKGTQAEFVIKATGAAHISIGDMLRAGMASGSFPKDIADGINAGKLAPNEFVNALLEKKLGEPRATSFGFLIDGFPRTLVQAEALDEMLDKIGASIDHVVSLEVSKELLMERAVLRRRDKKTGTIYHLKYNPPPPDADIECRKDDTAEAVNVRLDTYERMTQDILPYYKALGVLRQVDGVGTIAEVRMRLFKAIGLVQP